MVDPAGGRHDLAYKPVVRLVVVQALLDPVVKREGRAKLRPVGTLVAQQRRPFVRKILGILLAPQQPLDEPLPLVWCRVAEKRFHLGNRWQASRDIERDATKISRVPRHLRRRHAHLPPFRKNESINEVLFIGKGLDRGAQRYGGAEYRRLVLVANHHRNLTRFAAGCDQAGVVRFGVFPIVRLEDGRAGDIVDRPVGHPREHDELLARLRLHDALWRMHLDGFQLGIVRVAVRHALAHPVDDRPVVK